MSQPAPPPGAPRGLIGFLDALRDGSMVVGWASDPTDKAARPIIRLMRGVEVLAECGTDAQRDDGNPGFRLVSPTPLTPQDFLEGRVRIRAMLPGRQAATTLAMTRRMRAALEEAAGWEPTTEMAPPPRPAPPETPPAAPAARPAPPVAATAPPQRAVPPQPPPSAIRPSRRDAAPPASARPDAAAPASPAPPPPSPTSEPARIALQPAPPTPPRRAEPAPPPRANPPLPAVAVPAAATPAPASRDAAARPLPRAPGPAPSRWVPAAEVVAAPPPAPAILPSPAPELAAPLDAMLRLAEPLLAAGIPGLHLLVPRRSTVVAGLPLELLTPLEEAAASRPALAQGWLPLRHAFAHRPQPTVLWRADGARLSVEGGLALMETLLAALRACRPDAAEPLARIATLLARAELTALPRRHVAQTAAEAALPIPGGAFFGVAVRETEAVLTADDLFYDMPPPRPVGEPSPGLEAWSSAGAPLPWRVLLLAAEGMGGSAGPAAPGWWLRHLAMECVFSEALATARPEAVIAARPDLVLTLAPEPPGPA